MNHSTYKKVNYYLIMILCFFMPLHSMVIDKVIGPRTSSLINLWRDAIIILLLLLTVNIKKHVMQISVLLGIIWMLFCVLFSLVFGLSTPYLTLNMARTYIMPMVLLYSVSSINLSKQQFEKLLQLIWAQGIILSIFGFVQVNFLGSSFLTKLGYGSNGNLSVSFYISGFSGYQRMVSTFSSPNDCGLYLSGIFLVSLIGRKYICQRFRFLYYFGMIVIYFGIILTFSRTSLLAVSISSVVYFFKVRMNKISNKKLLMLIAFVLASLFISLTVDRIVFDSRFFNMFTSGFKNAFGGADASASKHIEDLYLPIKDMINYPFGYGFGTNGPVAASILGEANSHSVESSIWLIGYETGFIGILLYYFPFVYLICKLFKRNPNSDRKLFAPFLALCVFLAFLTLPFCSSYESTFLMFLFAGIGESCECSLTTSNVYGIKSEKPIFLY